MYREWPFFAALLSNLDMVLAKTDLHIAERYVELVPDVALGQRIFAAIRQEWQATQEMLTLITGDSDRLSSNPALARSIAHCFPYIDLLNHLQVELMRRHRASKKAAPEPHQRIRSVRAQMPMTANCACAVAFKYRSMALQWVCAIRANAQLA